MGEAGDAWSRRCLLCGDCWHVRTYRSGRWWGNVADANHSLSTEVPGSICICSERTVSLYGRARKLVFADGHDRELPAGLIGDGPDRSLDVGLAHGSRA